MKKFYVIIGVVVLIVLMIPAYFYWKGQSRNAQTATVQDQVTSQSSDEKNNSEHDAQKISTVYTMSDVQKANTEEKCWTVVEGKIYDITSFLNKHPGGKANVMKICGNDGTSMFNKKHGEQPKPEQTLQQFLIGTLQ